MVTIYIYIYIYITIYFYSIAPTRSFYILFFFVDCTPTIFFSFFFLFKLMPIRKLLACVYTRTVAVFESKFELPTLEVTVSASTLLLFGIPTPSHLSWRQLRASPELTFAEPRARNRTWVFRIRD